MIRFDQALPALVRLCEGDMTFRAGVERTCVVRDLRGRLRLAVKPVTGGACELDLLAKKLGDELGGYFHGPILSVEAQYRDEARLAAKLLELSQPWEPAYRDPFTDQLLRPPAGHWRKLERRLGKQAWLDEKRPGSAPWELDAGPPVVTFYSFKGGVGRTTALASCAWQLARDGKRVAVLDLDLEGPGAGALLEATAEQGVLDFLVDHLATGSRDLNGLAHPARALGQLADKVEVITAGRLDVEYLEKLARLDFQSVLAKEQESPIEAALRALLHAVRKELRPDFVFLDARSGLRESRRICWRSLSTPSRRRIPALSSTGLKPRQSSNVVTRRFAHMSTATTYQLSKHATCRITLGPCVPIQPSNVSRPWAGWRAIASPRTIRHCSSASSS